MKVSYIVKSGCLALVLCMLPLHNSYAGCGCGGNSADAQEQNQDQEDIDNANPDRQ